MPLKYWGSLAFYSVLVLLTACREQAGSLSDNTVVDSAQYITSRGTDMVLDTPPSQLSIPVDTTANPNVIQSDAVERVDPTRKEVPQRAKLIPGSVFREDDKKFSNIPPPSEVQLQPVTAPVAPPVKLADQPVAAKPERYSHEIWDGLLGKHVDADGLVDYKGFMADRNLLEAYISLLSRHEPSAKSKAEQLAYWINLYNAQTVKVIIDHYPLKQILDIEGGKVWSKKDILVGKQYLSLEQIEKEKLIRDLAEVRVHFALVCAAKSCPPLHNKAYTAQNVQSLLDSRTASFVNNTKFNRLEGKSAELSKIFEWYAQDFGDVIAFINKYATKPLDKKAKLKYLNYDWSLNQQ